MSESSRTAERRKTEEREIPNGGTTNGEEGAHGMYREPDHGP
jgi:hypothetical protein